ncbi:hypothetical protein [Thermoleptolyngbya sp. C42_A2020_037]|uniref:hypothetical protein n=1 Tax=Thermoleptolyngbya sp. C42_A2020_037 TaxID=2747799 RepID=UPI001A019A88|nr:hypothetical protein [Thermoleptolyngbya sp. C42_A2020_037]MBF2086864.1 hypothetical protein [Thermoleptolyngbya sp. C42_A2020_037]
MLLDEDSQAKYLVNLLQAAEHDVVTVNAADLTNRPESVVLDRHSKKLAAKLAIALL